MYRYGRRWCWKNCYRMQPQYWDYKYDFTVTRSVKCCNSLTIWPLHYGKIGKQFFGEYLVYGFQNLLCSNAALDGFQSAIHQDDKSTYTVLKMISKIRNCIRLVDHSGVEFCDLIWAPFGNLKIWKISEVIFQSEILFLNFSWVADSHLIVQFVHFILSRDTIWWVLEPVWNLHTNSDSTVNIIMEYFHTYDSSDVSKSLVYIIRYERSQLYFT